MHRAVAEIQFCNLTKMCVVMGWFVGLLSFLSVQPTSNRQHYPPPEALGHALGSPGAQPETVANYIQRSLPSGRAGSSLVPATDIGAGVTRQLAIAKRMEVEGQDRRTHLRAPR